MCRRVRASFSLHTDDTPVRLLNPRRTAYAWVYVGDLANPYTVFDLSPGHQQEFPQKFLAGYRGFIHADGYAGYNPLYAAGATHVGCWMHVRRYFFEAKESDPARAHEAMARIRLLVRGRVRSQGKRLAGAELAAYRQEHARPLLQAFADWLAQEVPRALPKSKIGEAFIYASNQWPSLTPVYRRWPTDDRQLAGRASDSSARGGPPQLAADCRRWRPEECRGAPEHGRDGQASRRQPVGVHQTSPHRVGSAPARCRLQ